MNDTDANTRDGLDGLGPVLAGVSSVLADADRTTDRAMDRLLELGCRQLGARLGLVTRVRDAAADIRSLWPTSGGGSPGIGDTLSLDRLCCGRAIEAGQTVRIDDAARDGLLHAELGDGSYLGTPVRVAGEVWGVLGFYSRPLSDRADERRDRAVVELLAGVVGSELEREGLRGERDAANQAAEHARRETQIVLDRLRAMVWRKDTQGRLVQVNRAAAEALGLTPEQMVGRPVAEFYPDQAEPSFQEDRRVMADGRPRLGVVETWREADGTLRYLHTDRVPTRNPRGEIDGVLVVCTDITHLKRAEDELRSMNVRFGAFMRNTPAIKWAIDEQGRFAFVNAMFEQVLGVSSDAVVGKPPREALAGRTGRVFEALSDFRAPGSSEGEVSATTHIDLPIQGRVVPLMVTRFTYSDAQGRVFLGGSAVDLTDVTAAQRELASRNKDLKALLYVISHDLREPLRAIRNFSEMVVEREAESLGETSRDMLARVTRGAERLDQLLSDVLTLSRAQRAEPAQGAVSSEAVVREVLADLQASIERSGAGVEVGPGLPMLSVDAFWLRQAVNNLVCNALKFTRGDQPPSLSITAYRPPADAPDAADEASDEAQAPLRGLVFDDAGPGVEPHQRERIFGLFQRGVAREVPGTGAGLAIVAQVAERYDGRVWVEDAPGGGARFILAFR